MCCQMNFIKGSNMDRIISWFSAGVSSAVATKLMIDRIDQIIYTHIDDQHPDTMRFVRECEEWFGKPVEILQSPYLSVGNVVETRRYVNGPAGAACTENLKRKVRKQWEYEQSMDDKIGYVWGMDADEADRADRIKTTMPDNDHYFPLIAGKITKKGAHQILKASGIARPIMYDLGYSNNNCIGCVKGGMGYWNHIRVDFPDVFESRSKMERQVGRSCINGTFLDELDPEAGRHDPPIVESCGILCEVLKL